MAGTAREPAPPTAATRLAWALCFLSVVLALASVALATFNFTEQYASLALGLTSRRLAVAALFQPARRRVQQVDLRFNRRKYDAARTIELFSARLRDQVDLDMLSAELLATVDQTMQPAAASSWLRPSAAARAPFARARAG